MGFTREAVALGSKRGIAILGVVTTFVGSIVLLLAGNLWLALILVLGFLALVFLDLAHQFWKQRDESAQKREAFEATPGFRIDALLKRALALENDLKHGTRRQQKSETQQRRAVLSLIFDAHETVADCAPAHVKNLTMQPAEGGGKTQFLNAVEECYRVLAAVRKHLQGQGPSS